MEGLQRSAVSFRRQGSSGLVWDDKFLKELNEEANKQKEQEQAAAASAAETSQDQQEEQQQPQVDIKPPRSINTLERSRSNGGGGGGGARGYRTGRVSPAVEPPSPRVSACGFCGAFAKKPPKNKKHTQITGKRRSRPL